MHCFAYKRYCPVLYFPCKIRYTEDHIGRIFIFCRLWQFQYGGTVYVSFMGKIWKDNRMLQDTVVCDDSDDTRTHKIFHGLEEICYQMDLGNPIWLDATVRDFKKHDKARFYQDNFIEHIEFDYLEIQVIEED